MCAKWSAVLFWECLCDFTWESKWGFLFIEAFRLMDGLQVLEGHLGANQLKRDLTSHVVPPE